MATVKSHIYEGKMVHAIYTDLVDEALTAGVTAETIISAMSDAAESGEEVPALAELRVLNTTCKKVLVESEESGAAEKYLVRAVLRYVPESEESK